MFSCFRDVQLLQGSSAASGWKLQQIQSRNMEVKFHSSNPTKTPNTQRILTNIHFKQLKHVAATLNGIHLYDSPENRTVDINFSE